MDSNHRSPKAYALQAHAFAALPHVQNGGRQRCRTLTVHRRGDCFQGSLFQPPCLKRRNATFRETVKEPGGREEIRTLTPKDWFLRPARLPKLRHSPLLEDAARIELAMICFAGRPLTDWVGVRKMCFC